LDSIEEGEETKIINEDDGEKKKVKKVKKVRKVRKVKTKKPEEN
jgi:hypothetical protein